jgi:threonine/homoserine/homoserine lactone efflux protein
VSITVILCALVGVALGQTIGRLADAWNENRGLDVFMNGVLALFFVVAGCWLIGGGAK